MPIDKPTAAKIYVRLANLRSRLSVEPGLTAVLEDNVLTVTGTATGRKEIITCARRPDDHGTLWFYDHDRESIVEADNITDAAVHLAARVRQQADG